LDGWLQVTTHSLTAALQGNHLRVIWPRRNTLKPKKKSLLQAKKIETRNTIKGKLK
jgi:hypothetical protein